MNQMRSKIIRPDKSKLLSKIGQMKRDSQKIQGNADCSKFLTLPREDSKQNALYSNSNIQTNKCAWCQKIQRKLKCEETSRIQKIQNKDFTCQFPIKKKKPDIYGRYQHRNKSNNEVKHTYLKKTCCQCNLTKPRSPDKTVPVFSDGFNNSNDRMVRYGCPNGHSVKEQGRDKDTVKNAKPHYHHCCFCEACSNNDSRKYGTNRKIKCRDAYDDNSCESSCISVRSEFSSLSI